MRIEYLKNSTKLAVLALIASLYSVLTIMLGEFGYSWIQIRISEALTPLPFLLGFPGVAGLTLGCAIANLLSPVGLPDMIFGPLLTLLAALLSWKANFGKRLLACIYPVLVNALGVSVYLSSFYEVPFVASVAAVFTGEFIAAVLLGYPLLTLIGKSLRQKDF